MTDTPERIWACAGDDGWAAPYCGNVADDSATGFVREDLSDAKDARIAELEAELQDLHEGLTAAYLAGARDEKARAEAAEAKLAVAVEALKRIAHASDVYGVEANAEDQGAETLAYAHKSTCNLARATLKQLKGTDQ